MLKYIAVHDDIYGGSQWRALRKLLPIPWLFEGIPYSAHGRTLHSIRVTLGQIRSASVSEKTNRDAQLIGALIDYVRALDYTVGLLQELCSSLADKANGEPYSWSGYRTTIPEYENARQNHARLGEILNEAFRNHAPED